MATKASTEVPYTDLILEPWEKSHAQIVSQLQGHRRNISFNWNGREARLEFVRATEIPLADEPWSVEIEANRQRYFVTIHELPDIAWIFPELAGTTLSGLPEELAKELLSVCLQHSIAQVVSEKIDLKIIDLGRNLSPASESMLATGWRIDCGSANRSMSGVLAGGVDEFTHLTRAMVRIPTEIGDSPGRIPLRLRVSIGQARFTKEELEQLAENDVIINQFKDFQDQGSCRLLCGHSLIATGRITDAGISIATTYINQDSTTLDPELPVDRGSAETEMAPLSKVSATEIVTTFALGHITVYSDALASMQAGDELSYSGLADGRISILANEYQIATGCLVGVGSQVGVKILDIKQS